MQLSPNSPLQNLMDTMPQSGVLRWIGIRPNRNAPLEVLEEVNLSIEEGLEGDHYAKKGGNRQLTLIQAEHLELVSNVMQREVDPGEVRRNLVVSGINLLALKDREVAVGEAIIKMTGFCHPCSRMEKNLGAGGYNAMRGHGGMTAKVVKSGKVRTGDAVRLISDS